MVQVPARSGVTRFPLTLQAVEVVENVTGWPDAPAVALTANAGSVAILSASVPKVSDCAALLTATVWVTRAAAAYFALPPWSAATVQFPAWVAVSVVPLRLQLPAITL